MHIPIHTFSKRGFCTKNVVEKTLLLLRRTVVRLRLVLLGEWKGDDTEESSVDGLDLKRKVRRKRKEGREGETKGNG